VTHIGIVENPVRGVSRPSDRKRERFLSSKELAQLGDALTAAKDAGAAPSHVVIIRLLALTGARKNEIARLAWPEVDLDRRILNLGDSKTGQKVTVTDFFAEEGQAPIGRSRCPNKGSLSFAQSIRRTEQSAPRRT
jgi:integrase